MKTVLQKLTAFVNQRPGLDFNNYGDVRAYRSESREITADRNDFFELYNLASMRYGDSLEQAITKELTNTSGRLSLVNGELQYITGQYFPTEYRPAANRVLVSIIWNSYRDEKDANGNNIYATGHEIRKAARRNLSRRTGRLYFN